MEMHHKLRRDPNWHKDACNLCGQEQAAKRARQADVVALEKQAREYAKKKAEELGLDYDEIIKKGKELQELDPAIAVPKVPVEEENPLPIGWASAQDPQGRTYFYHKKTMKTQWDRPTDDTPIS